MNNEKDIGKINSDKNIKAFKEKPINKEFLEGLIKNKIAKTIDF